jgi:MEMO1 family protein
MDHGRRGAQFRAGCPTAVTAIRGPALAVLVVAGCLVTPAVHAEPAPPPERPTLEQVRSEMAIRSHDDVRGQKDSTGYASTAAQMDSVWRLAAEPPAPETFETPTGTVAAVIAPHDDYLYAGRVYRRVLPLVTARTVIVVGVFHRYRRFGEHDRLVFDDYSAWRTPDGPVPVAALRGELLRHLPSQDFVQDAASHDSEHSVEALVYWLHHARADLEIVPVIVPACAFGRLDTLARELAGALRASLTAHRWQLGRDVAIAISTDGIHYGPDFHQTRFGDGGITAYTSATELDRGLLTGPLRGEVTAAKAQTLYETFVDPDHPDTYRWTWCGRFSVPFGMLLLAHLAPRAVGHPLAYATSVGTPELPVRALGLGATAPANLYHFVGYPAAAFTVIPATPARRASAPR